MPRLPPLALLVAACACASGPTSAASRLDVTVDGAPARVVALARGDSEVALAAGLGPATP
jgi:hypothetical protein